MRDRLTDRRVPRERERERVSRVGVEYRERSRIESIEREREGVFVSDTPQTTVELSFFCGVLFFGPCFRVRLLVAAAAAAIVVTTALRSGIHAVKTKSQNNAAG